MVYENDGQVGVGPGSGRSGLENLPGPQVPPGKGLPAHEPVCSAGRGAQPGGGGAGQPGAGPDAAAAGDAGAAAQPADGAGPRRAGGAPDPV